MRLVRLWAKLVHQVIVAAAVQIIPPLQDHAGVLLNVVLIVQLAMKPMAVLYSTFKAHVQVQMRMVQVPVLLLTGAPVERI